MGMENAELYWAIGLFLLAILLIFFEVLLPTGGMLGVAGAICAMFAIYELFMISTTAGMLGILAAAVCAPLILFLALKIFPHTLMGRLLILSKPASNAEKDAIAGRPQVGDRGEAITPLHTVGICLIGGHKVTCMALAGGIDAGKQIEVVNASGMNIKVKVVEGA